VIFPIRTFLFIYVFFLILEKSQYVGKDVKPYYKGLEFSFNMLARMLNPITRGWNSSFNMLARMFKPYYKGLEFIIQYVGKRRVFHNVNEYNK